MAERDREHEHGSKPRGRNLRTGLILLSIALAFFVGIVAKYWLFGEN